MNSKTIRFLIATCVLVLTFNIGTGDAKSKLAEFSLKDINNKTVRMKDHLGNKVILLSFWATWCKPCVREMVHLEKMYKEFNEDDFIIFGIAIDNTSTVSRVKPFVRANKYTYPMLLDTNSQVLKLYNPTARVPYSILVNKEGEIVTTHSGYSDGDERILREEILGLIKGAEIKTLEKPEPVLRKEQSETDNDG